MPTTSQVISSPSWVLPGMIFLNENPLTDRILVLEKGLRESVVDHHRLGSTDPVVVIQEATFDQTNSQRTKVRSTYNFIVRRLSIGSIATIGLFANWNGNPVARSCPTSAARN